MNDEPMSLGEAIQVSKQVSPLPQVAHQAMNTLVLKCLAWEYFFEVAACAELSESHINKALSDEGITTLTPAYAKGWRDALNTVYPDEFRNAATNLASEDQREAFARICALAAEANGAMADYECTKPGAAS